MAVGWDTGNSVVLMPRHQNSWAPYLKGCCYVDNIKQGSLHGFERSPLLSALLCALHCLWQQLPYKQPIKRWVTILIWYRRKLSLRRIKKVSANHRVSKWQGWDLSLWLFDFQAQFWCGLGAVNGNTSRGVADGLRLWTEFCLKPQGEARLVRKWRLHALADSFQIQNSKKNSNSF